MTADNLSTVVGVKGDKEVQLPLEHMKTIFLRGENGNATRITLNPWFQYLLKKQVLIN